MRLVLLGAPGAGKGTQGNVLAARFGVPHVSSGELLRKHVAAETDLGREIAEYLERGELVPDNLILTVVLDAVTEAVGAGGGYVLDGFPRTIAQAEQAYEFAKPAGITADAAVYLDVPDEVAIGRLVRRADDGRVDDADADVIARRLQVFHDDTRPLLDFYGTRGILVMIDATQPVGEVTDAIIGALETR